MNIPPLISRTPPPLPDDDDDDDEDGFGSYVIGDVVENGTSDILYHGSDGESGYDFIPPSVSGSDASAIRSVGIETVYDSFLPDVEVPEPFPAPKEEDPVLTLEPQALENGVVTSNDSILSCDTHLLGPVRTENSDVEDDETVKDYSAETVLNVNRNHVYEYSEFPSDILLSASFRHNNDSTNEFDSLGESSVTSSENIENPSEDVSLDNTVKDDKIVAAPSISLDGFSDFSCNRISNESIVCHTVDTSTNLLVSSPDLNQLNPENDFENEDITYNEEEDEFSDFATFQTSTDDDIWHKQSVETNVVKEEVEEQLQVAVEDFKGSLLANIQNNAIWSYLRFLDDTPALKYQWLSSTANHKLLAALKIDSRNIFCGPWNRSTKNVGSEVNLPTKSIPYSESPSFTQIGEPSSTHHGGCHLHHSSIEVDMKTAVPDAHFDWEGSGLVNPLFYSAKDDQILQCDIGGIMESQICNEAQDVLKSLPDLSYMTKAYLVFKKNSLSH